MTEPIIIGKSVKKRPIRAYLLGQGRKKIALVAGVHGNEDETVDLVSDMREYFQGCFDRGENFPNATMLFIPIANPDAYYADRRCNAHDVDLNRNWGCGWKRGSDRWGYHGSKAFSEPETRNLRKILVKYDLIIDWHIGDWQGDISGFVMPGGDDGRSRSARTAKLLAAELNYLCEYNGGQYPGTMTDYLNRQGVRACGVEIFNQKRSLRPLFEMYCRAVRKLIKQK